MSGLFTTDERPRAWRVVSTVINLMLIGLAILAAVIFVSAPVLVPAITPGFGPAQLDKTIELTRIMLLSPIFLSLGAVATSVLNSGGRFAASAIAPIVYNLAIIGAALLLAPTLGVDGLALGVVAGSLGHLLVQLSPLRMLGFRYVPHIDSRDPQARRALTLMAPRAIGLGVTQITFIVVTSLASLVGTGAVSDFNFAFALLQIPLGIIGVPLGIVLLPTLSRDAAVGREQPFADLLTRGLRLLIYVMIPIAVLSAVARDPIVEILFGSGRISPADLEIIAVTLTAFLVGLTAHAMIAVLARAFYARQDTVTPVAAAVGAVIVNSTLAVILVNPFGLPGIALAIAIAAWGEALVLMAILHGRLAHFQLRGMARVGVESIAGSAVAGDRGLVAAPTHRRHARPRTWPAHPARPAGGRQRRVRGGLRARLGCLADTGTAVYRRGHGRRLPPSGAIVTAVEDAAAWDRFVETQEPGSYMQRTEWAAVKAVNGWTAHRIVAEPGQSADAPIGAQILVRRPRPMPWGFAYAPRGPVATTWSAASIEAFTTGIRDDLARRRRSGVACSDRSRDRGRRAA